MDRKTGGTVAVFIVAVAIIVAGVVNQYLVNNAGAGSDAAESETTTPAANSETTEPKTTNPTDGPDATEPETATPTGESETSEPETAPTDLTIFRAIVNEVQELDVLVPVNVVDGLTREEAELIAEATFVQVKGEEVMRRLDSLTLDEDSMEAHYTWGLDEGDMGHFFDIAVDIESRLITVTHCF